MNGEPRATGWPTLVADAGSTAAGRRPRAPERDGSRRRERALADRLHAAPTAPASAAPRRALFLTDFRYTERAEREVPTGWSAW